MAINRYAALVLLLATAGASAENGVTDDRIVIGQTVALTGQIAGAVREMNAGALAYIHWVNRRGGMHGRKIELRTMDDRFDPATAAANAETLIKKEKVFALFLNRGTPHTEAILAVLAASRVPLVAPSTGAAVFRQPVNRLVFNVRTRYQNEVAKAVEHFTTVGIRDKVDLGGLMVNYSETDHAGSEFVELTMIGRNGRFIR